MTTGRTFRFHNRLLYLANAQSGERVGLDATVRFYRLSAPAPPTADTGDGGAGSFLVAAWGEDEGRYRIETNCAPD